MYIANSFIMHVETLGVHIRMDSTSNCVTSKNAAEACSDRLCGLLGRGCRHHYGRSHDPEMNPKWENEIKLDALKLCMDAPARSEDGAAIDERNNAV